MRLHGKKIRGVIKSASEGVKNGMREELKKENEGKEKIKKTNGGNIKKKFDKKGRQSNN